MYVFPKLYEKYCLVCHEVGKLNHVRCILIKYAYDLIE